MGSCADGKNVAIGAGPFEKEDRLARKNPFRGLTDLISETNRTSERWMTGMNLPRRQDAQTDYAAAWAPITDVFLRGEDMVIRCDLAGVMREDVDVTVSNGILTIFGERKIPEEEEEATFYVSERSYGLFRRTISLPEGVGEKDISADFEEGVLEVIIAGISGLSSPRSIRIGGPKP